MCVIIVSFRITFHELRRCLLQLGCSREFGGSRLGKHRYCLVLLVRADAATPPCVDP